MVDPDLGEPEEFTPASLPKTTRREFILLAGLLNFGLLTAGAGTILLIFTEEVTTGGLFLSVGAITLLLAGARYLLKAP